MHVCKYCSGERFSSNICSFQERKESSARGKEVQWQVLPKNLADFLLAGVGGGGWGCLGGRDIVQEKKKRPGYLET